MMDGAEEERHLYTFVLEHAGGTYIAQESATNLEDAIRRWTDDFAIKSSIQLGATAVERLRAAFVGQRPVPIEGMRDVWCISSSIGTGLVLVHIVHTRETL
jgi:hypothetical protein